MLGRRFDWDIDSSLFDHILRVVTWMVVGSGMVLLVLAVFL